MHRLLITSGMLWAGLFVNQATAQQAVPAHREIPLSPLNVTFTRITKVDLEGGKIDYVAAKPISVTEMRQVSETIVGADGKPQVVTTQVPATVTRLVVETRQMQMEGHVVTTTDGTRKPLPEAAKTQDLTGRDVLVAPEPIDRRYFKYLGKDVLIIEPVRPEPKAPVITPPGTSERFETIR